MHTLLDELICACALKDNYTHYLHEININVVEKCSFLYYLKLTVIETVSVGTVGK